MHAFVDEGQRFALIAVALAACFGWAVGVALYGGWKDSRAKRRLALAAGLQRDSVLHADSASNDWAIRYAASISKRLLFGSERSFVPLLVLEKMRPWFLQHGKKAGLSSSAITVEGFAAASLRLGFLFAACGIVFGACFSDVFAVFGLFAGMAAGFSLPFRSVLARQRMRALSVEQELSEMLEVVALALRSGLSFDRGFQLYCQHFCTPFARSCEAAWRTWSYGLDSRESALRDLADSYDSVQLDRVVRSIARSLRFGSSLADVMERLAFDVRQAHRAHVQERVAKAPVKMMIPTGSLILPAMLLLVLGPVLLELMVGF